MGQVFLDANVVIAARLARDQHHERAREITDAIDRGELPPASVPSDVLEEIVNYLQVKAGHKVGVRTLDAIVESSGFEVEQTAKRDFNVGQSVYRAYENLSLTDSIIVAAMQRRECEYLYSFDDDFDGVEGVTRLTTADDPFR